ncbi:DUF4031 domain-containing protein [Glutamicibacter sp.]|uniref:DUF4031 domain-containing protein n=1 Tax=Glutamicibacter sp. TaxID=1931995 RepID=UPI0028BDA551|nr:DUF4031 domain-containing protein [Glutamicibacter sp.]
MGILIDPPLWPAHGTYFSHLVSDISLNELHEFAKEQQLPPRAFDRDHYDVPLERFEQLVTAGARKVTANELVKALITSGLRIPAKYRPEKLNVILARRWAKTLPTEPGLGRSLLTLWAQEHRHYHDRVHLLSTLEAIDWLAKEQVNGQELMLLQLAAWFHDAVYEATAEDEAKSAILARERLNGILSEDAVSKVSQLVLLTAGHNPQQQDKLGRILCDADLEVLARPAPAYQRYAEAIYCEYSHYARSDLAKGRIKILGSLLEKPAIYNTQRGAERWEAAARSNLSAEIKLLETWL